MFHVKQRERFSVANSRRLLARPVGLAHVLTIASSVIAVTSGRRYLLRMVPVMESPRLLVILGFSR
jgi:hypothetical protein